MHHLLSPVIDFSNNVVLIYRDVHAARLEEGNIHETLFLLKVRKCLEKSNKERKNTGKKELT